MRDLFKISPKTFLHMCISIGYLEPLFFLGNVIGLTSFFLFKVYFCYFILLIYLIIFFNILEQNSILCNVMFYNYDYS